MATDGNTERDAAISRLKAKQAFRANLVSFVVINAFLVGIWAVTGAGFFWPIFPILGWGIGIAMHAWQVYGRHGISEEDVAREIERGGGTVT
ncbi:MAG TPA: 2TM domain-containing protein [Acidimicrobiia bacterium]|nr:2TM domain-containing protein [Acidimicrobiia bacterium]